jgi:hypothetical protein
MNREEIRDKPVALVVWNTEKQDDVHVYVGKLVLDLEECFFVNQQNGWKLRLSDEQMNQIEPIPERLKTVLLGADYALNLTIGSLPDTITGAMRTGMQWHDES